MFNKKCKAIDCLQTNLKIVGTDSENSEQQK